jgi:hypothetical protein
MNELNIKPTSVTNWRAGEDKKVSYTFDELVFFFLADNEEMGKYHLQV